jgi:hypothetical protein
MGYSRQQKKKSPMKLVETFLKISVARYSSAVTSVMSTNKISRGENMFTTNRKHTFASASCSESSLCSTLSVKPKLEIRALGIMFRHKNKRKCHFFRKE